MTHMTNYGNDQLALYTVSRLVNFVHRWTNLELKYAEPTELADIYFNLFPKDKAPVWLVSYVLSYFYEQKSIALFKRKPDRIGLLFTLTSGDFRAISVTEQSCVAPISNVERHILDTLFPRIIAGAIISFFASKGGGYSREANNSVWTTCHSSSVPLLVMLSRKAFRVGMKSYPA